ncbi:cupin domain-containing protein [Streptomyces spectabilis]|uniref:JmjC domain-containing protein n=1 Tax=Streptomyces spectabilis TaxID=68270 RepID=UPI0033E26999
MSLRLLLGERANDLLKSWPTEPFVHRRGTLDLDRDIPLSAMEAYIDYDLLDPRYVAVVKNGTAVHPGRFSREGRMSPGKLRGLMEEGHTVNLREVQRSVPYLAQASRMLQLETGYANYVSAIITPGGEQGLAHHWDQFTGIIAQVAGCKKWLLWEPVVEYPMDDYQSSPKMWSPELQKHVEETPPDRQYELRPGDTLVLPRGWLHCPRAVGVATSFHLTFAVKERSRLWLAQQLLGMAIEEPAFRREVPAGSFTRPFEPEVRDVIRRAQDFLAQLDPAVVAEQIRRDALTSE